MYIAAESRSVIITDGRHILQFTRLSLTDPDWLVTQDDHHLPQLVGTEHVQRSIDESAAAGCSIATWAD